MQVYFTVNVGRKFRDSGLTVMSWRTVNRILDSLLVHVYLNQGGIYLMDMTFLKEQENG